MLLVCSTKRDDACPQAQPFASKAVTLGGRAVVLPVEMKHGEINKELGLSSDYTTAVEAFMHSLGLPKSVAEKDARLEDGSTER